MRTGAILAIVLSVTCVSIAQNMASSYQQAAQAYNNAAAQCQNPVGAACMRANARYNQCLANQLGNGPACTAPVCNTSCLGGTATGSNPLGMGTTPAANAKINNLNNAINLGQQLWSLFHQPKSDLDPDDSPAPDPAAAAAEQQQIINAEAADLLASANSLLPSQPSAEPSTQPDSNTAVSALLEENTPSNAATAAVNSLLGDTAPLDTGATSTATAVAGLLDDGTQPADANSVPPPSAVNIPQDPNAPKPGDPFYQPPMQDKSQWYTPPTPLQDSEMNADLQDSVDQPNPSMFGTLKQELQSGVQTVKDGISDGLNSLVTSGKSLLAPIMNDPGLQAIYHVVSNGGTTMPLTTPTDSGDTMVRNVAGQAWLGSTDMIKNGPVAGRYGAGTKMIDQNSAYMGWAQANIPTISGETQP